MSGCRGASPGGRGGGGTVGDRIRGLGVLGRGGGVLGDPYHMGAGGGGSNTEHGTIYMVQRCQPPPPPTNGHGSGKYPPPPPVVVVLWLGCGGLGLV